ncbi:uncharacterized protein LOC133325102 [Musca vetustissima]|uniref:uncharacterized protein LOC133325102 n=1 Tax=Musca vetustissima TaxID=27455 RepID=UPI002AB69B92|nr:uncharacterized protein LOC133325102 [Musca vetustissima]
MGRRSSNKQRKSQAEESSPTSSAPVAENHPKRIFLYLQPKSIFYPLDEEPGDQTNNVTSVEIELQHQYNTITKLADHYTTDNIIHLEEFSSGERPTFSITLNQDDIDDVNNCFLTLNLYVNLSRPFWPDVSGVEDEEEDSIGDSVRKTDNLAFEKLSMEGEAEVSDDLIIIERRAVAQGYIDLLDFFCKTRVRSMTTVFLYPLTTSNHRLTCKIEWEIYSLHPLVKDMNFANVLFLTFASIYNIEEDLLDNSCEDLIAKLSMVANMPNENGDLEKIPLCSFRAFSKQLISDQVLDIKWENLKNSQFQNEQTMTIMSGMKVNPQTLFYDLLKNENSDINLEDIDGGNDSAWICNSMFRYVLSDDMERQLEDILAFNSYNLLVEFLREGEPDVIVLQGTMPLSVFMYPQVHSCTFAIEMRPPGYRKPILPIPKDPIPKKSTKKGKRRDSQSTTETSRRSTLQSQSNTKEKVPFAIMKIYLQKPITQPIENMTHIPKSEIKCSEFIRCPKKIGIHEITKETIKTIREEAYRNFDDTILEMADYVLRHNIRTMQDDRQFYNSQLSNLSNKILRLVACDFNRRVPTHNNIEFSNLMTMVYQELSQRIYGIIMECSPKGSDKCLYTAEEIQNDLTFQLNICKYLYEVGNSEFSEYLKEKLLEKYEGNPMLNFYLFLWNIENQNFIAAQEYLKRPLKEKYIGGEYFSPIIELYITYKQTPDDFETPTTALENLIYNLSQYCENNPQNISSWILLYCLYKQTKYLPGIEYCRWKYENLCHLEFPNIPPIPTSRWDMYLPYEIDFKSAKAQHFYKVVKLFTQLGLYQFAEWVFNEIAAEALEFEQYMMAGNFNIFLNRFEKKFNVRNFPVEKYLNPEYLRGTLSQVNGNIEYYRNGSTDMAMKYYAQISEIKVLNYAAYNLGIIRYAYYLMREKDFEKAKDVFSLCCQNTEEIGNCIIAHIGKAKACYQLGDLNEAEMAFANSTRYGLYLPNVWAYMALINLKQNANYQALECWKYAHLDSQTKIHSEIINELEKIDYKDVNLYIDIPELKS